MAKPRTVHFLLVYSHSQRKLIAQREFHDAAKATAEYEKVEREHYGDQNYEIVLVGSDSIETIMKTHGHYFHAGASDFDAQLQLLRNLANAN